VLRSTSRIYFEEDEYARGETSERVAEVEGFAAVEADQVAFADRFDYGQSKFEWR
jgi:hypothetical protein